MSEISTGEKIKNGDIAAFEKVFREYYAPLTLFAVSLVKDRDTAEEIVQDFFYVFWKNRAKIDIQTTLKNYFFQSVRNKALKYLRHQTVKKKYKTHVADSQSVTCEFYQPNIYDLQELENRINKVLDKLPANGSKIFRMNRFEGLKYNEIAEKLNISVKTVEANISKALKHLREELKYIKK